MTNPYSVWDFELDSLKIELKYRDNMPGDFSTQVFTAQKADKLVKQEAALYIVGFKKGIYYLNMKAVNFAAMKKEKMILKGGKVADNYIIPFEMFTKIIDKEHLLSIIQDIK